MSSSLYLNIAITNYKTEVLSYFRHCSEIVNKHELNRTVYGYLEDIDHCIDDLCKKMETSSDTQGYCFKPQFVRFVNILFKV